MTYEQASLSSLDAHYDILEGLGEGENYNLPAAIVSAAYGYSRGRQHSPFNAALFGLLGYAYPILGAGIVAFDAVFLQDVQFGKQAGAYVGGELKKRLGFNGLDGYRKPRRCKRSKRTGRCLKRR